MSNFVEKEAVLGIEELFFSTTDQKGIITAGNEVFVRVSGYEPSELLGKPHNRIRHPDMPRAVFYLLWEEIRKGNSLSAYVKNRAKDGSYYWVFANVVPLPEGYISVRLKPTSTLLPTVQELYKKTLNLEKKEGMEKGLEFILNAVRELGFSDYQSFMTHAFSTEMEARDKLLLEKGPEEEKVIPKELQSLHGKGLWLESHYRGTASEMIQSVKVVGDIGGAGRRLALHFSGLHFMGINLLAAIERIGSSGTALSQVVVGIGNLGSELKSELTAVEESLRKVLSKVRSAEYLIQSARLQAEMTKIFMQEMLVNNSDQKEKLDHCMVLFKLTADGLPKISDSVDGFSSVMKACQASIDTFSQLSSGMEFIRLSSKIESSRLPASSSGAVSHFNETLGDLIIKIRSDLDLMSQSARLAQNNIQTIQLSLEDIRRAA